MSPRKPYTRTSLPDVPDSRPGRRRRPLRPPDVSESTAIFTLLLLITIGDDPDGSKRKRYIRQAERAMAYYDGLRALARNKA